MTRTIEAGRTSGTAALTPARRRPTTSGGQPRGAAPAGRRSTTGFLLVVESPVGPLTLGGDGRSVTHLFLPNTGMAAAGTTSDAVPPALRRAARQLDEYFAGRRTTFGLPLAPAGTAFQLAVWTALAAIPYGETISYAELALRVGRPSAYRAVGQANGANPLAILYPCHRVVASGGAIGGYGGGLDVKRQLLALEGHSLVGAHSSD